MRLRLSILLVTVLAGACSKVEEAPPEESADQLCTAAEAGAVTAAKATELVNAVKQGDGAARSAACAKFREVIEDGSKAGIPDAPNCRWDDRNSNGNPRFLISLHLTQLKGQVRAACGRLE